MFIFDTGADDEDFGKMVCHWDKNPALMTIRRNLEAGMHRVIKALRQIGVVESPNEAEMQQELDSLMIKAGALIEEYALVLFFQFQGQLVADVMLKIAEEMITGIRIQPIRDGHRLAAFSYAEDKDLQAFKEVRKNLSEFFKRRHNELLGIKRGPRAQASVKEIIECLKSLPKERRTLAWVSSELGRSTRAIQHTLKVGGLTFTKAKKIVNAQR